FLTTAIQNKENISGIENLKGVVIIPNETVYKKASEMVRNLIMDKSVKEEIAVSPEFYDISQMESVEV
ncbi:hypothetical protein J7L87_03600, partial [bacterium]|nr:hypothetical protein [bacterium]